jgi:hypothetical protein
MIAPLSRKQKSVSPGIVAQNYEEATFCTQCFKLLTANEQDFDSASARYQIPIDVDSESFSARVKSGCQLCILLDKWLEPEPEGTLIPPCICRVRNATATSDSTTKQSDNYILEFDIKASNNKNCSTVLRLTSHHETPITPQQQQSQTPKPGNVPPTSSLVASSTASPSCCDLIEWWINDCNLNHKLCSFRRDLSISWLPTRLVFLGDGVNEFPRLCSREYIPLGKRYNTLSHRWGPNMFRLLSSNLGSLQESLPLDQLPATYLDAMEVSRKMGIEYLWIDSLCIIQDSGQDWRLESAAMGLVYKHAWCCVAATACQQAGILINRPPIASRCTIKPSNDNPRIAAGTYNLFPLEKGTWSNGISDSPLSRRGWVTQERLLSSRIIHFGERQMFWECQERQACETFANTIHSREINNYKLNYPASISWPYMLRELAPSSYYAYWRDIIRDYNVCQLTMPSDRLDAIAGVAKDIQTALDSRYLAGIWEKHICADLLWSNMSWDHVFYNRNLGTRNREYQAPSWSWASFNGAPWWIFDLRPHNYVIEYVRGDVVEIQAGSLGQVKSGFIHLRGLLINHGLTIQKLIDKKPPRLPSCTEIEYYNYEINLDANPEEDPRLKGIDRSSAVYTLPIMVEGLRGETDSCLLGSLAAENLKFIRSPSNGNSLLTMYALLLLRTGNGEFQRLGLLSLKDKYVYACLKLESVLKSNEYIERHNGYLYTICIV